MIGNFPALVAIAAVLIQGVTGLVPDAKPKPKPALTSEEIAASLPMPPSLPPLEIFASLPDNGPVLITRPTMAKQPASVRKPKPAKIHRKPPPPPRVAQERPVPSAFSLSIRISL